MAHRPVLAVLLLAAPSPAQLDALAFQPYTRMSPDGRWQVRVIPDTWDGRGSAQYYCAHEGREAWSGERPWALADAVVTDEGFVAGYSYSQERVDPKRDWTFHVVILSPDGATRLDEKHERTASRHLHAPPNPLCTGVFQHPELGRVVFRIADPDVRRGHEEWWCFGLPSGAPVLRARPVDRLPKSDARRTVLAVRAVRDTPLHLVEWGSMESARLTLRFALLDSDLNLVWESPEREELDSADHANFDRIERIYDIGTLADEQEDGRFAIGLPMRREMVQYIAERAGDEWTVRESGRMAWSLDVTEQPASPEFDYMLATPLVERSQCDLPRPNGDEDDSQQAATSTDGDVLTEPWASAIDTFGRALVQDRATGAIHVFDARGQPLFVCHPERADFPKPDALAGLAATREGGVVAGGGIGGACVRFGHDGARLAQTPSRSSGGCVVESPRADTSFGGSWDGGFVQFGPDMKVRATFDRASDGSSLTGHFDPVVAPDGAVAVLSGRVGRRDLAGLSLVLYEGADPRSGRAIPLPANTPACCLALGTAWAVLSSYRGDALLVRRADGMLVRIQVPASDPMQEEWRFGFDGDELVALNAKLRKIRRFALP